MPDLTPYSCDLPKPFPSVLAVGWLTKVKQFQTGKCPEDVLEKLNGLILRKPVNQMRGTHRCDICWQDEIRLNISRHTVLLGAAEVWVPDGSRRVTFAAPNLIVHYITQHAYLPPEPFIEAIRAFVEESTWDGQLYYEKLSREAYG